MQFKLVNLICVAVLIQCVSAKLNCQFYGNLKTDLVCKSGSSDFVLSRGLVSDNNKTTGITLRDCRITDIKKESFQNLFSLTYIDLSVNKIQNLSLGVLDGLRQVTYLNLSYNQISNLSLGIFDQKHNLEVLDLKGNQINSMKLGIFDSLRKLKHLDLSSNAIKGKDLNPYIFDRSKNIKFLDFSRNDMQNTPDNLLHAFQSIDFLNLDRTFLSEVPKFATWPSLKTMRHLMLSTNKIKKIEDPTTFINLDKLEILNLVANSIEYINDNAFQPLKKLKKVTLRQNRLKSLPETLFQNLAQLSSIDLAHNLLENISPNTFRGTSLATLNLAANKLSFLADNFCLELRNSGARLTKFSFHHNPWQCGCLWDILKEVKKFKIEYHKLQYDGQQIVCVTEEFQCHRQTNMNSYYVEMFYNSVRSE